MTCEITKTIIGVRCPKCGLPGLLDQKPGHFCVVCAIPLKEHRVDTTNCNWCSDNAICIVCAKQAYQLRRKMPNQKK